MKKNSYLLILSSTYVFLILWFTVLGRGLSPETAQMELFWSYREWFSGNSRIGLQIIGNIILFVPLGFMLAGICKKRWTAVFLAFLISSMIELSQLLAMRGLCELDDIFDNTLGGLIGTGLYGVVGEKKTDAIISIASVLGLAGICFFYRIPADSTPRGCCFQVDEDLSGFFMFYDHDTPDDYSVLLKSAESGQRVKPDVEYSIERQDVNEYFACEYDYSKCGFRISSVPENGEYEFIVQYKPFMTINTGVYLCDGTICYTRQSSFQPPDMEAEFVDKGYLRVYRPDYPCWVYQYDGALYWIFDENYCFEDDGSTKIQYQIWTTQIDKLPQHRLERKKFWDNIGAAFEDNEMEGDFGNYRVMKREIPTDYAVTAIKTGYYTNHRWIWKEYFRPIYEL